MYSDFRRRKPRCTMMCVCVCICMYLNNDYVPMKFLFDILLDYAKYKASEWIDLHVGKK